jgi:hypothetical protein
VDLESKLRPVAEALLGPGEDLRGFCIATQVGLFTGRQVVLAITDGRLIAQGMNRKFEPVGDPISLPPERIANASAEGAGMLGKLGGGETQRQGLEAMAAWFAQHAR